MKPKVHTVRSHTFNPFGLQHTFNRGQNSLGHISFALKEAFLVCKLLHFTANAPPPPTAMLVAGRRHICQVIFDIFISFQHCNAGWGDHNSKFPP